MPPSCGGNVLLQNRNVALNTDNFMTTIQVILDPFLGQNYSFCCVDIILVSIGFTKSDFSGQQIFAVQDSYSTSACMPNEQRLMVMY